MSKVYDVIVLGAGPAGLAAGLYAGRSRLSTLVIEKGKDGGQIAITDDIENYPGQIVEGESGPSLIARMTQQCEKFGVERASDVIKDGYHRNRSFCKTDRMQRRKRVHGQGRFLLRYL